MSEVYLLVIEVSKQDGDDLPEEATGAAFMALAPAEDEEEAVRDAVKLFKEAGFAPLEVTSFGTQDEREKDGAEISVEERKLADEAAKSKAIIVLDKQLYFDNNNTTIN